ncbi:hypothetical protein ABZS66_14010 [Dactylosporangium sp. NPDC005572]|uniref:hypothetical protein n=1 Tax=Dactylosporangium sp. NPDC005572 TaxID=3156889 RepID=UPI0033A82F2E
MTTASPIAAARTDETVVDRVGRVPHVAGELLSLAEDTPELGPCRAQLVALAAALDPDAPDEGWADLDVVATFGRPESVAPAQLPRQSWRIALDEAPAVLVFLPVLITWFGLAIATLAYGRMLADPATRAAAEGRSFLQLWQEGFGGKLPTVFDFGHIAFGALVLIGLLIIVTVVGLVLRRRDDARRQARAAEVSAQLLNALVRAQLVLNQRRLASPVRFAAELSQAALLLGELLTRTGAAQDSTASLADRNARAAEELSTSIVELRGAVSTLDQTGAGVRQATETLDAATARLSDDLTHRATAAADRLEQATAATVGRLDAASEQATTNVGRLQTAGEATLREVAGRIDGVLGDVAVRIGTTTDGLRAAGERFAAQMADSSRDASVHIGEFYGDAVATAAVTLAARMAEAGRELDAAVEVIRASAERNATTVESATGVYTALAAALTEATTALRDSASLMNASVERHAGVTRDSELAIGAHTERLAASADAIDGTGRSLVASTGRIDEAGVEAARHASAVRELGELIRTVLGEVGTTARAAEATADAARRAAEQTERTLRSIEARGEAQAADLREEAALIGAAVDRLATVFDGVAARLAQPPAPAPASPPTVNTPGAAPINDWTEWS